MAESANPFSSINFGLLIAYLLPGFIGLYAMRYFSGGVTALFHAILDKDKGVGASFLILIGSLVVGLIVSAFRDFVLERVHYATGVEATTFNYGKFIDKDKRAVLEDLISNKYRFYQFYGNTLIAALFLLITKLFWGDVFDNLPQLTLNALVVILLFLASREALTDMFDTYRGIEAEIDNEQSSTGKLSGTYNVTLTIEDKPDP